MAFPLEKGGASLCKVSIDLIKVFTYALMSSTKK